MWQLFFFTDYFDNASIPSFDVIMRRECTHSCDSIYARLCFSIILMNGHVGSFFQGVISSPVMGTTLVAFVNVVATWIALLLMDSTPRRTLILWSVHI